MPSACARAHARVYAYARVRVYECVRVVCMRVHVYVHMYVCGRVPRPNFYDFVDVHRVPLVPTWWPLLSHPQLLLQSPDWTALGVVARGGGGPMPELSPGQMPEISPSGESAHVAVPLKGPWRPWREAGAAAHFLPAQSTGWGRAITSGHGLPGPGPSGRCLVEQECGSRSYLAFASPRPSVDLGFPICKMVGRAVIRISVTRCANAAGAWRPPGAPEG